MNYNDHAEKIKNNKIRVVIHSVLQQDCSIIGIVNG